MYGLASIYCENSYKTKETNDYDCDVSSCEELYGIASIYCEDPYLTEDVYRVADPSAGQFKYYRHDNPKKPVNIVKYKNENMIHGGHNSNTASEFRKNFPKNTKQYIRKDEEYDKKEKEIKFLKN